MKQVWKALIVLLCIAAILPSCDIFQPPFDPAAFFAPMFNDLKILIQTVPLPPIITSEADFPQTWEEWRQLLDDRPNGFTIPQSVKNFANQYVYVAPTASKTGDVYLQAEELIYIMAFLYQKASLHGIHETTLPQSSVERSIIFEGGSIPNYIRKVYLASMIWKFADNVFSSETPNPFITVVLPFMKINEKPYLFCVWGDEFTQGPQPIFPEPYAIWIWLSLS